MSFIAREIMIDVFPARDFPPAGPGFALCTEVTRNEDEDDELDCEVTRPPAPPPSSRLEDLACLRQQLRQAMSATSVEMTAQP